MQTEIICILLEFTFVASIASLQSNYTQACPV